MSDDLLTWEQAVQWLRQQPDQQPLVHACYYDDPLLEAAKRFAESGEWQAVNALLPVSSGVALDLGAGRGISSFALALAGWQVTALEPDPSSLVGAGAIRKLAQESGLPITVVEEYGETLPFDAETFDVIYGRQVLHHAHNLPLLCREAERALKPGGLFIATREHVISKTKDLDTFLASHPLHKFYGGENAYLLNDYISAIAASGLRLEAVFGPFDSEINYFPMTYEQWRAECSRPISQQLIIGPLLARLLTDKRHWLGRRVLSRLANRLSNSTNTPGRLYSFVAIKQ